MLTCGEIAALVVSFRGRPGFRAAAGGGPITSAVFLVAFWNDRVCGVSKLLREKISKTMYQSSWSSLFGRQRKPSFGVTRHSGRSLLQSWKGAGAPLASQ